MAETPTPPYYSMLYSTLLQDLAQQPSVELINVKKINLASS